MAVLLKMLLKSGRTKMNNKGDEVPKEDGIHPLTQVVLSVFWFFEFGFKCTETVLVVLQETHALHVSHTLARIVVDSISEVNLVRKKNRLRRGQGHYWSLGIVVCQETPICWHHHVRYVNREAILSLLEVQRPF